MANKKDYIFAPGGLNLDWYELLEQYPDDANKCYLVALCGRQISVLLDLAGLLKWTWLWGVNYHTDKPGVLAVTEFKEQLEHCLMAGCDVEQLITAVNEVRDAIAAPPTLTDTNFYLNLIANEVGRVANNDANWYARIGEITSSLAGISNLYELMLRVTDINNTIAAGNVLDTNRNDRLCDINTSLVPLGNLDQLQTLLGPLENLDNLAHLSRLDTIAGVMAQCCDKTQVPDDLYIPIIFKDEQSEIDHKCKAANILWQELRNTTNTLDVQDIVSEALTDILDAISSTKTIIQNYFSIANVVSDLMVAVATSLVLLIRRKGEAPFLASIVSKLDANKSDFILAMYDAPTAIEARNNAVETLGALTSLESIYLNYFFTDAETKLLFIPGDLPTPDNPVICNPGSSGGGIPDACSQGVNSYTGDDSTQWLDGNGNIIMDTWHEFSDIGEAVFYLDARYHVQLYLIAHNAPPMMYTYVPGDGNCQYLSPLQSIAVDQTVIFDCTALHVGSSGFEQMNYRIRFATQQG